MRICPVCVVRPENDFNRMSCELRVEAVVGDCCANGRDSDSELVQFQFDMVWLPLLGRSERFFETDAFVKPDEPFDVVRVDVD